VFHPFQKIIRRQLDGASRDDRNLPISGGQRANNHAATGKPVAFVARRAKPWLEKTEIGALRDGGLAERCREDQ